MRTLRLSPLLKKQEAPFLPNQNPALLSGRCSSKEHPVPQISKLSGQETLRNSQHLCYIVYYSDTETCNTPIMEWLRAEWTCSSNSVLSSFYKAPVTNFEFS